MMRLAKWSQGQNDVVMPPVVETDNLSAVEIARLEKVASAAIATAAQLLGTVLEFAFVDVAESNVVRAELTDASVDE